VISASGIGVGWIAAGLIGGAVNVGVAGVSKLSEPQAVVNNRGKTARIRIWILVEGDGCMDKFFI
jgi:hypothetical protein